MTDFAAKTAYVDSDTAIHYDRERKGWFWNHEMRCIGRALKGLDCDSSFLDIPCGTGRFVTMLARRFRRVQGTDISAEMLKIASKKLMSSTNVSFAQADAETLPFGNNEFDYCLSIRFFGHTPPDVRRRVFRELARVTKQRLLLVLYVRDPLITTRKFLQRFLGKTRRGLWYPYASISAARHDLDAAGLEVVTVRSFLPFVMESRLFIAKRKP